MHAVPIGTTAPIGRETPDAELVRRAAGGEDAAFEAIMRRHNRLLFRTARAILKADAEAEDALQDAYLHAWRALSEFRADAKLSSWLVRIVANEALGRLRRKPAPVVQLETVMNCNEPDAQTALAQDSDQSPDRLATRAQLRQLIEARIDRLPEPFRMVFVLRAVEDMSVEEVAQALAIPQATVRTRFFRARSLMRENLSRDLDLALADAFAFDGERCDRIVRSVIAKARSQGL